MTIRALPHILSRVFGVPLLIQPARLDALLLGLNAAMLQRGSASPEPATAPPEQRPRGYRLDRGVAIVPVHGVLVRRAGQIDADSTPLQSYEALGHILRAVRQDPRARGVLLEMDSPGGEAGGVFDLAAKLRDLARVKPVWAIANEDMLSAAYVLAAPAQRIWTTQTAAIGSLGVVAVHTDRSAHDAAEGFKYTYVYRGARKIDANPHMPLAEDARRLIQNEVDRVYGKVVETVARHRGIPRERLEAQEAGIYFGEQAHDAGLSNHLGTLEEAIASLAEHVAPAPVRGRNSMNADQTDNELEVATEPEAPATGNVIQLDQARAAGAAAEREIAYEIAEMCKTAMHPEWAAEYIRLGNIETARQLLQERLASEQLPRQIEAINTTQTAAAGDSYKRKSLPPRRGLPRAGHDPAAPDVRRRQPPQAIGAAAARAASGAVVAAARSHGG